MDFNEYQRIALTTAIYPNQGSNLAYPALGLAGESGEICEKIVRTYDHGMAKELGDVLWYVAMVADEIGENLNQVAYEHSTSPDIDEYQKAIFLEKGRNALADTALGLAATSGAVCGKIKKIFRDDGSKLTKLRRAAILADLSCVLRYVAAMATDLGESLEHIAKINIDKLASRNLRGTITGDGDDR